jgi:hypothetical protein
MKTEIFFIRTGQSLLIWMGTNLIATFLYAIAPLFRIELDPYICLKCSDTIFAYIIGIGSLFSFPVIFLLVPNLYVLSAMQGHNKKIWYAGTSVFILCASVILIFLNTLGTDGHDKSTIALFLLPYIFSAEVSFFSIARNVIYNKKELTASTTNRE